MTQLPRLPSPLVARIAWWIANWLTRTRRKIIPPSLAAIELGSSSWAALAIDAFAELGIAGELDAGGRTGNELAAALHVNPPSLYRLLRALTGYDVVREDASGRFWLTPIGRSLTDRQDAIWPAEGMVRYANAHWHLAAWNRLAAGVRSGKVPFEIAHGQSFFEYCSAQPDAGAQFDGGMQSLVPLHVAALLDVYDFRGIGHLIDVGGGTGFSLAAILSRNPRMRGTLFEASSVIERARAFLRSAGVSERCTIETGDFFMSAPPGGDAYLLSHVLHDWDDAPAGQILRTIRDAMPPHGRLLIVEILMDARGNHWSQGKLSDLEMLVTLGGRERTRAEFEDLLAGAGLRIARTMRTAAAESVIETTPR